MLKMMNDDRAPLHSSSFSTILKVILKSHLNLFHSNDIEETETGIVTQMRKKKTLLICCWR